MGGDSDSDTSDNGKDGRKIEGKVTPIVEVDTLSMVPIPEGHTRDLTRRDMQHIEELKRFIVPSKIKYVDGKQIQHKEITFYKSEGNPLAVPRGQWATEESNTESIPPLDHCTGNLIRMFERLRCTEPLPKERIEMFEKMWHPAQRKVTSLEGHLINTRGLGFEELEYEDHECYACLLEATGDDENLETGEEGYEHCIHSIDETNEDGLTTETLNEVT